MVVIDRERCIGCGSCVKDCVASILRMEEGTACSTGPCIQCGHCVAICPSAAVSIPDYDMDDVEELNPSSRLDIQQVLGTVKARRSIRHFTGKHIPQDKLENIIQAGRYTATGSNRQACRFVVVQKELPAFRDVVWSSIKEMLHTPPTDISPEMVRPFQQFVELYERENIDYLFRDAPAVLLIAADSTVDAGLAAQNMELAAVAQGLGALYNGFLVYATGLSPAIRDWADAGEKPVAVAMLLGYPDVTYRRTAPRKKADVTWR